MLYHLTDGIFPGKIAFGPTGSGAHAAVEYVEIDSVIDVAKIFEMVIHNFCG